MKIIIGFLVLVMVVFLVGIVELYSQIWRHKAYWDKQNVMAQDSGSRVYVAIGDSTAQGIGSSLVKHSYVNLIAKHISEKDGRPVTVRNFSKTGATVRDALDRQVPLLQQQYLDETSVVTVSIGANDMANFEAATFEAEMDELMGLLPRQALIADIPYFKGSRYGEREAQVRQANEIMYRLAKKHNFELVALHQKMEQGTDPRVFAFDWFHPSAFGYKRNWAPVFTDRL